MSKTAFIVPDALTLLAAVQLYPHGFVGVGRRPRDLYCLEKLTLTNDWLKTLVGQMQWQDQCDQFFLLLPNPDVACALRYDMADPVCKGCGRPIRKHWKE